MKNRFAKSLTILFLALVLAIPIGLTAGSGTVKASAATSVASVPSIVLEDTTEGSYNTSYTFTTKTSISYTNSSEYIIWEYSNNKSYTDDGDLQWVYTSRGSAGEKNPQYTLSAPSYYVNPGDTVYVRARIYNPNSGAYSSYSESVKVTSPGPSTPSATIYSTKSSVTLSADSNYATGYIFQKYSSKDKKWVTVAKQTSNTYKYTGLSKNTLYKLRVRAYYCNESTGKTVKSDWYRVEARTWTANLNLTASQAGSKSVKLKWNKVSGATGYEIYRSRTSSSSQTVKKGEYTSSYTEYVKVKSNIKSSTTSYTDKGLTSGRSYTYVIRAYRKVGGKKVYISSQDSVTLKKSSITTTSTYYNSSGKYVVKWKAMSGMKGYYLEKYNDSTGKWSKVKTLKSSATSCTVSATKTETEYRIRPYDSKKTYSGYTFWVEPKLAVVTGVSAKKTSSGVKITWKAVSGATYYRVYRTTSKNDYVYDSTTKSYSYGSYDTSFYVDSDDGLSYTDTSTKKGVTYYYYVRAYNDSDGSSVGSSKLSSAILITDVAKAAKPTSDNISVKSTKKGTVTLTLKKNVSGAKGYAIYRATKKDGTYKLIGISTTTKKGSKLYTDKSAKAGKTYYYKVSALTVTEADAYRYSSKSSAFKVKVKSK